MLREIKKLKIKKIAIRNNKKLPKAVISN